MIYTELPTREQYTLLSKYFTTLPDPNDFLSPITKTNNPIHTLTARLADRESGNNLIGVARCFITREGMLISYLAVDVDYRGMGVGAKLIKSIEGFMEGSIINKILCNTRESNTSMRCLLQKLGFRSVVVDQSYSNGDTKIHHIYEINSSNK
jgi:GNAT superfamily N-acetyltransferase